MTGAWRSLRLLAAVVGLSAVAILGGGAPAYAGNAGVPYPDPNAVGTIGLCNEAGQQITHGSTSTTPFAWRAVSSQPAQAPYNESGRTATLFAFQPRKDLPAGEWSGEALTASARYTNSVNPMAAATNGDSSLKDFIDDFPPSWDGLVQLRIYLGAPDHPIYSLNYPATNIKVTGQTWRLVGAAAPIACNSGRSVSIESILLPKSDLNAHGKHHAKAHVSSTASPAAATASAAASAGSNSNGSNPVRTAAATKSTDHTGTAVAIVIAALVVLLVAGYVLNGRRRRSAPSGPPIPHARSSSEKGR
jgi:hypothetical protein